MISYFIYEIIHNMIHHVPTTYTNALARCPLVDIFHEPMTRTWAYTISCVCVKMYYCVMLPVRSAAIFLPISQGQAISHALEVWTV